MRTKQAQGVALASAGGAVLVLAYIVLRQIRVVRHLPDPPGEVWDSDRIVMSKAARPFGVPDGVLGLGSYAITAGLIASGSELVRMKLVCDAGAAAFNVGRQVVKFRKMCSWCILAAGCTIPMVWFGWRSSGRRSFFRG
ncbi:MAG TPA: vitamin K epoxide reductase family protein [Acidobacteriaceae bacterium]|nr:vitamin K epoxide reductase family protein [Acidobacteriaceae bacterium]